MTTSQQSKAPEQGSDQFTKTAEKVGAELDKHMEKFAHHGFVETFINNKFVKSILESSFIKAIDDFIRPHFKLLMQIIGVIALIGGVLGLLGTLGGFGMMFTIGFWGSGFVVVFVMALVGSLLSIVEGYGLLYKKRRIPFLMIVVFLWGILSIIFNQLFWSTTFAHGYGYGGGNYVISFLLGALVLLIVLKNRAYFSQ